MPKNPVVIQPLTFPQLAEAPREPVDRPSSGRLAAIDIGSNSIHMIVVAPEPQGGYRVLGRERDMVRLGKTGFRGALSEAAIRDGLEALVKMTTLARLKGAERVVAVATSAVREAANGQDFLSRVKAQTGMDVQLLTGVEEGRLIYRAVREAVDLGPGRAVIVDVAAAARSGSARRRARPRWWSACRWDRCAALPASTGTRPPPRRSTVCGGASRSSSAPRCRRSPPSA